MGPKLKSLTVKDYRSFVDESLIEFPESGLVSLNGINKDTGGGSGSGKSNIITAVAYALGFSPLAATEFKSWYSDKTPFIQLELDTDLGVIGIRRHKTLQLWIDDVEIPGSVAQKETRIDELFGMNAEFRKLLTHRGQRQPGSFLSNTDAKKKEFLMQILGLDKFEEALEIGAKNITKLEGSVESLKEVVKVIEATLGNLGEDYDLEELTTAVILGKNNLGKRASDLNQLKVQLATLHKDIQNQSNAVLANNKILYQDALDKCKTLEDEPFVTDVDRTELNRLAKMVSVCKERIETLTAEDRIKKTALSGELRKLQEMVDEENGKISQLPGLDRKLKELQTQIAKLELGQCSMCGRAWDESQAAKEKLLIEREGVLQRITDYSISRDAVYQLQQQMLPFSNFEPNLVIAQMVQAKAGLESKYAVEKQKIDSQKAIYLSEKNAKLSDLRQIAASILAAGEKEARQIRETRMDAESSVLGNQISDQTTVLAIEQEEHSALQQHLTRAQFAEEQRKLYLPKLDEAIAQLAAHDVELASEKDFLGLIGREGFLGSIFDEILVEISDETNAMLAAVANVRHVTIEFKSESVTQKGTVNRSIVPVVTVGGNESSIKSGLSGGMLSVVELATDLAVGKVIATRTGTCPQFLALDEALDGLGPVEKESALELIQNYAQSRLVIMTDHTSEFKSRFTKQISIEYSNGRSIVV